MANSTGYRKMVLSEAGDLLKHQSLMMHKMLMLVVAIYSVVFTFLDFILVENEEAWMTLAVLPLVGIAYLLYRVNLVYWSKVFNVVQTLSAITVLGVYTGTDSLVFMYFFPIIIATFLLFQGKEMVTAIVISSIAFLMLLLITYADIVWGHRMEDKVSLMMDQVMNIIGVAALCIVEMYYVTQVSSRIQHRLVASSKVLDIRNKQLMSTVYTRDRMMSVISHDLRSPVATLNTAATILESGELELEVQKSFLHQFNVKSAQLLLMIDQLLDWSRAQTNTIKMNRTDVSMMEFERYIKSLNLLLGGEKEVKIVVDFNGAEDDSVFCDKNMIEGVFRNLIANAVKFSNPGSTIKIHSLLVDDGRKFVVEDEGKGMTAEQIENIKKGIGFTTEGTMNEVGHGFGLQLVKEFLQKHNSSLDVMSTVGKGSRFSFVI